jgi:hypothetical protein
MVRAIRSPVWRLASGNGEREAVFCLICWLWPGGLFLNEIAKSRCPHINDSLGISAHAERRYLT